MCYETRTYHLLRTPLASARLGVAALVEFEAGPDGESAYPVEHKRGKPKPHRPDEVQL